MPKLQYYTEFREVLASYSMSERAQKALEGLHLVLMVAPFSSGRNTVIKHLIETRDDYYFIISDTTREPQIRDNKKEESGVNYFFRTEEEMLADLRAGEFLEAAIIHELQVSGISVRELEKAKNSNKIAITDIEIVGADSVVKAKPDTKVIFLVPPSFEEWQERIASRGKLGDHEMRNRLMSAAKEFEAALRHPYYQFVISDDIEQSASIIDSISHGEQNPHHGRAVGVIHQLQDGLQQKLASLHL
jgi:guanylate kinase